MGRGRKCRLQISLPHRYECVNFGIPRLGPRFAATSCRASHAYPCLFPLDTDTGNCRKTCPTIMHPPPLLHLLSAGVSKQLTRTRAPKESEIVAHEKSWLLCTDGEGFDLPALRYDSNSTLPNHSYFVHYLSVAVSFFTLLHLAVSSFGALALGLSKHGSNTHSHNHKP